MNSKEKSNYNKDLILNELNQLLAERKKIEAKIATKQEQVKIEDDKKIVETASSYTVENIVKGLANLQLDFNIRINDISTKLLTEISKLEELKRAIRVETQYLDELRKIRIVAESLNILAQENQQKTRNFETEVEQKLQALDNEIAESKTAWQKEQNEYEAKIKERQEKLKKERVQKEADYKYEIERKRKIELDQYEEQKRALERRLSDESEELEITWEKREKVMTERSEELENYRALVKTYPKELEDGIQRAKDEAIKEVHQKAHLEAQLFNKEVEANKEVYELKIKSFEEIIGKQSKQIEDLSIQLQAAIKQTQELTVKTVESTEKISKPELKQTKS